MMKLKNEPVVAYKEHLNAMKTDWTISYNRLCIFCRVLQPKNLFGTSNELTFSVLCLFDVESK